MQKKTKKLLLTLGMVTPTLFGGCLGFIPQPLYDAAVNGATIAVENYFTETVAGFLPVIDG